MDWDAELRVARDHAAQLTVSCASSGHAYDAALECGPGVKRTSFGGATRGAISAFDKPLIGIFRWTADTDAPVVLLTWSDVPEGPRHSKTIHLA